MWDSADHQASITHHSPSEFIDFFFLDNRCSLSFFLVPLWRQMNIKITKNGIMMPSSKVVLKHPNTGMRSCFLKQSVKQWLCPLTNKMLLQSGIKTFNMNCFNTKQISHWSVVKCTRKQSLQILFSAGFVTLNQGHATENSTKWKRPMVLIADMTEFSRQVWAQCPM